jgi:hypothetical protein
MKRILGCVLLALAPAAAGAATTTTPLQLTVTVVPAAAKPANTLSRGKHPTPPVTPADDASSRETIYPTTPR